MRKFNSLKDLSKLLFEEPENTNLQHSGMIFEEQANTTIEDNNLDLCDICLRQYSEFICIDCECNIYINCTKHGDGVTCIIEESICIPCWNANQ